MYNREQEIGGYQFPGATRKAVSDAEHAEEPATTFETSRQQCAYGY
jgi:hypothetical protein